jgi:integrase/recombinase XerD
VRAGELVNIKLDDVEMEENRIRIHTLKGGDVRYVYFPDALKIELRDWIDTQREAICQPKENYLFLSANAETKGQQLSRYRPNRIVKQAADRAGINEVIYEDAAGREHYRITSHILRHTFAHRMLYGDSDMDLNTLSALLGHSTTAETAETYLHPSEEMIKQEYDKASGDLSI